MDSFTCWAGPWDVGCSRLLPPCGKKARPTMRWSSRTSGKGPQGSIPRPDWETGPALMTSSGEMGPTAKAWDAPAYQESHSYIWQYGTSLVEMLNPQPGERVLDLGCGTGHLTAEIARAGSEAVGIDNSPDMVRIAKENFPDLVFPPCRCQRLSFLTKGSTPCFPTRPSTGSRRLIRSSTRLPVA